MSQYIFSDLQEASFSFLDPNHQWTYTESVMIVALLTLSSVVLHISILRVSISLRGKKKKNTAIWQSCF